MSLLMTVRSASGVEEWASRKPIASSSSTRLGKAFATCFRYGLSPGQVSPTVNAAPSSPIGIDPLAAGRCAGIGRSQSWAESTGTGCSALLGRSGVVEPVVGG